MDRVNTAVWEETKFEHNYCLCYSEAKGLYVTEIPLAPKEDVLFIPHGHKGFWKEQVQLAKKNLTILVETNFGYGSRTYMRAVVERDGQRLLDFDKSKIYILNNCSVMTLDVIPYEWKKLFYKIISISKGFFPSQCTSSALSYVEEIDNILNKKEILIKATSDKEKATIWNDEYLITLFAADKIRDLIKGCDMANITDGYFLDKCIQLYKNFLHNMQEKGIDLSDSRTMRLAETLFMIHEFMAKNEKGLDFLEYFLSQNHK
jgi:hypothetical protein